MPELKKREVAHKLRIGEILSGKPISEGNRFSFLDLGDRRIVRINVVANVIDKYESEGEKKFATLTIDDASGQIQARAFGDDVFLFQEINQGHSIMIIGLLREFNNEVYILPEIIKVIEPRYLLIRKLELEKLMPKREIKKEEIVAAKDKIIEMIKKAEETEGIDTEKLILELHATPDLINQEIRKLLEEGIIYEPRPGRLRYLG